MAVAKGKRRSDKTVEPPAAAPVQPLDRFFGLSAAGTSIGTEFRAGLATFLTMAYIMFVNPAILEKAGMDHGAVFVTTRTSPGWQTSTAAWIMRLSPGWHETVTAEPATTTWPAPQRSALGSGLPVPRKTTSKRLVIGRWRRPRARGFSPPAGDEGKRRPSCRLDTIPASWHC